MTKSLTSYDILNISEQASQDEIHAAYRRLVKIWHPDRHPVQTRDRAHDTFKLLQKAYADLKTPAAQMDYNRRIAEMNRSVMAQQAKAMNDNLSLRGLFAVLDDLWRGQRS